MPWVPTQPSDAFWFAVAPLTSIPFGIYAAAAYVTDDYPFGKPDLRASVRNAVLWLGAAAAVHGWNLAMSPHNAQFVTGSQAAKAAGHIFMMSSWAAPAAGAATLAAVPTSLYFANRAVIQHAPVEQQQSMWRMYSQALTGTGPSAGLTLG